MEQGSMITLLCDDTVDGIFTAIYEAWKIGTGRTYVRVDDGGFMSMLPDHIRVHADIGVSFRVADSIRNRISEEAYTMAYQAALSNREGKAQYIYGFLQKGFRTGSRIVDHLYDEDVRNVFEMSRYVWHEAHKYTGFVRFEELDNGLLVSRISPSVNVIPLLCEHFSDRLRQENWMILDTVRGFAVIHRAGYEPLFLSEVTEEQLRTLGNISSREKEFQDLWTCFYDTIAIDERKDKARQLFMMPKRYRRYMTAENRI